MAIFTVNTASSATTDFFFYSDMGAWNNPYVKEAPSAPTPFVFIIPSMEYLALLREEDNLFWDGDTQTLCPTAEVEVVDLYSLTIGEVKGIALGIVDGDKGTIVVPSSLSEEEIVDELLADLELNLNSDPFWVADEILADLELDFSSSLFEEEEEELMSCLWKRRRPVVALAI